MIGLALSPWPFPEATLALVKRAKAELALDYQVIPVRAVAGCPTRILALREPPPFLCDCAVVIDPTNYQSILGALEWVLCDGPLERGWTVIDQLRAIMGPGVKEVTDDDDDKGKVVFD